MKFHRLGQSELLVSELCLGTMTFGQQNTPQEAEEQLDLALERGINFIDAAEMYPVPARAETQGRTESILGDWLARKARDRVIVATKIAGQGRPIPWLRGGSLAVNRQNVRAAVEASLERLLQPVGYLRTARALAPHLIEKGWGRIINIGGLAIHRTGRPVATLRNVGVAAITKNLADELGPKGINVTAVHPGATRTERTDKAEEAELAKNVGIDRIVDAKEVAWVVAFLASPKSVAINGDAIPIGGGSPGTIHY
jgi:NAD(P)-dependent dehydrogenase (short-subunit alcohol dehydrogenase family)